MRLPRYVFLIILLPLGCRSKFDATVRSDSIVLEKALDSSKSWYQTGDSITLDLPEDLVTLGDAFSVINESSNQLMIDNQVVALGLYDGMNLASRGFDLTARIYSERWLQTCNYGSNTILVSVNDDEKISKRDITIKDFEVFGSTVLAFSSNQPSNSDVGDVRFQGWLSVQNAIVGEADKPLKESTELLISGHPSNLIYDWH